MCCGCWEEYESPRIWNERVARGLTAVKALYEAEGCSVGGRLHIVIDDWNLEDDHLAFCAGQITNGGDHDHAVNDEERECLAAFQAMSEAERASCLGLEDGCWKMEG